MKSLRIQAQYSSFAITTYLSLLSTWRIIRGYPRRTCKKLSVRNHLLAINKQIAYTAHDIGWKVKAKGAKVQPREGPMKTAEAILHIQYPESRSSFWATVTSRGKCLPLEQRPPSDQLIGSYYLDTYLLPLPYWDLVTKGHNIPWNINPYAINVGTLPNMDFCISYLWGCDASTMHIQQCLEQSNCFVVI